MVDDKEKDVYYVCYEGTAYKLDPPSTLDGGVLGGGITSFYDFSITKNVFTMILGSIVLIFLFLAVARGYKRNEGKAPSGIQSFMEPFFTFIRDEVTLPMIGEKHYERFQPFIMTLFFFVLICNLFGLIPFFPFGANVTGNLAVTLVLAIFTFIVTNINGNGHYWEHIFWMPGIPAWVKIILTPVEILGLFIKPFSLMIRLFANISAGHIIILSLIGLIFLFGDNGASTGGAAVGGVIGGLFTAFMNLIELLVAFLQAFIFAILSASYIGAAVEEHHHDHDEAHAH
jgi:F-type H+-transporting ATPase subunit a